MNAEKTFGPKIASFINRQPTWLIDMVAISALILTFLTTGSVELFFIVVGLVSSFIAVMRSMKASRKDQ
jgi:hypothetical protein